MGTLPTFTKTWDSTKINQRIAYVSLNATMGALLYGLKNYLVATMGATVVYTCDGTTGPTSGSDHTDRWTDATKTITRGANAAAAQSFCVLTIAGVHVLLAYQGASDDIARMAFSQASLYTPAGTATNQPTATDETPVMQAITVIGATASADRVWSCTATSDRTIFRCAVYRSGVLQRSFGIEQCSSTVNASFAWTVPTVGWNEANTYTNTAQPGGSLGTAAASGVSGCIAARISGTNVPIGGGGETYMGLVSGTIFSVAAPELNAGSPLIPLAWASSTVTVQGKIGNRYDVYYSHCNGCVQGDTFDDGAAGTRVVAIGSHLWPWPAATALVMT